MVEVALKLLVGKVYAKLFEAVPLEVLKAKDVEYANVEWVWEGIGLEVDVEPAHNPLEQSGKESFS